jgi:hypothetical protein
MTSEKGMVMIKGLTEFDIQQRKHKIEHINLAIKIDNALHPQQPKLCLHLWKMKPSIAASITVANYFSKTKYGAQKLHLTACTFSETRELPENNQAKAQNTRPTSTTQMSSRGSKLWHAAWFQRLKGVSKGGCVG